MADKDETEDSLTRGVRATAARGADIQATATEAASEAKDDLEQRVESLRQQLSDLARQVEQFAEERLSEARELAAGVGSASADVARRAGQRTAVAARAVRDDPMPVVVALGVLALLTAVFVVRSHEDAPRHYWRR